MTSSPPHPLARPELVITELPGEGLIYNFADNQAHCVTALALRVLQRADGKTPVTRIAAALAAAGHAVTAAEVWRALGELARAGLVELPTPRLVAAGRREAMKQLALTAGLTLGVPMVWSIVAPTIAQAASVTCQVNNCKNNGSDNGKTCGMMGGAAGICSGSICVPSGNTCI